MIDLDAIEAVIRDGRCLKNGCDDFLPLIAELRAARAMRREIDESKVYWDYCRECRSEP